MVIFKYVLGIQNLIYIHIALSFHYFNNLIIELVDKLFISYNITLYNIKIII